jgi:hypothetical protein
MPHTAILLKSPPGCGKSAAAAQFAARHKRKFYAFIAGQEDPCDTAGVITLDKNGETSSRKIPAWWKHACTEPYVILADELTACSPEQFAAVLRATDDAREIAGHRLHDDTVVIAAMNPPEFAAGAARELAAPVLSRFRHRTVTGKESVDWMNGGPGIMLEFPVKDAIPQLPRVVAAYLRSNPSAALATSEGIHAAVEKQEPFACPRAWHRAACEEGEITLWHEYIGEGAAAGFINWFTKMDLPNPVEILAGRDKTVPARGDGVMATAAGIVGLLLATKPPSDAAIGHAMEWFRLAADAGHAGNAAVDLNMLVSPVERGGIGAIKASRYAKALAPYGSLLKLAGMLPN